MGLFSVRVTLRNLVQPDRQRDLELMVDTGSLFTWVDATILNELGIVPAETRQFRTTTGSLIERQLGHALVVWDGRSGPIFVVFAQSGDMDARADRRPGRVRL